VARKRSKIDQPESLAGRATPRPTRERQTAAVVLGPALRPLVELCLELGITSPEMERVLRAVFVDRAEQLLSKAVGRRRGASDVRIGLMIGVHRNFVRQIRTTKPRVLLQKVQGRHRGAALLQAWATDWQFLNAAGQPRDLPIRAPEGVPSFEMLVRRHMSGVSAGTAIAELRRSGAIRLLPDEQVRFRSHTPRPLGITEASIASVSERLQELMSTLLNNLRSPEHQRFFEGVDEVRIDAQRLAVVMQVVAKRAHHFIDALSTELGDEAVTYSTTDRTAKIGLRIFVYEKS
jgi:Family of unknown function (DUF6502)